MIYTLTMKVRSWCISLSWLVPLVLIQRLKRETSLKIDIKSTMQKKNAQISHFKQLMFETNVHMCCVLTTIQVHMISLSPRVRGEGVAGSVLRNMYSILAKISAGFDGLFI